VPNPAGPDNSEEIVATIAGADAAMKDTEDIEWLEKYGENLAGYTHHLFGA
jgi:hypothetical protein